VRVLRPILALTLAQIESTSLNLVEQMAWYGRTAGVTIPSHGARVDAPPVFAVGAVYGLASSATVLSMRSVRAVRWRGEDEPAVSASAPPREARRKRLAAPPP
jgi:hypothetical protein